MLAKTITYKDFNDVERTETFYFHMNEMELTEWNFSNKEGLVDMLRNIVKSNDANKILSMLKEIILKAYGKKSEDGRRFEKSEEISKEFEQTAAWPIIYKDIAFNDISAIEFIKGVLPSDISSKIPDNKEEVDKMIAEVIEGDK
jgi:hypothetical protein